MSQKFWYRLLFKVRLLEAKGFSFQQLVEQIFHATFPDFQSVEPWGSDGDGGNDGFIPSCDHYFQVYGPNSTSQWSPVKAAKKAAEDFVNLKSKCTAIQKYSFVINDRFDGIPAPIFLSLQEIRKTHGIKADAISAAHLTDMFMNLPEDRKQEIVGGIPGDTPPFYDPRALGELLRHLADSAEDAGLSSKAIAPDFDKKIEINGISDVLSHRLRDRSYCGSAVERFLGVRDQYLAQAIAAELRELYKLSKATIPSTLADAPDLRYVWMTSQIIPKESRMHVHSLKAYRAAGEVVLAKYFEGCDVYEQPTPSSGTP